MELKGFQRSFLRGLAHRLKPVVLVGHDGVTDAVVDAVDRALLDHELIKVRMHEPDDKKAMAASLAARCEAHLCGLIGHTAIIYRPHPEDPRIVLPRRPGDKLEAEDKS
jgi:RNA-binding protein